MGVLCAACGEATERDPCAVCAGPALLREWFRLEEVIGTGAHGTTYRAIEISSGKPVAVKELPLRRGDAEKTRELFEREARVLRELHHGRIPAYVDHFVCGAGRSRALFIVQEFIDGQTLAEEMRSHRYDQDEVLAIAEEILVILEYLHGLSPPVIHRDLKPGNVMRRRRDGGLVLVDFGAVRDAVAGDLGGSTVAGTFGYMAPEQFVGDATPATDLYGLGATCVALLTRRDPAALSDHANRLGWRRHASVHATLAALIDSLVEPDPAGRAQSAAEVRAAVSAIRSCRARAMDPLRPTPHYPLRRPQFAILQVPPALRRPMTSLDPATWSTWAQTSERGLTPVAEGPLARLLERVFALRGRWAGGV